MGIPVPCYLVEWYQTEFSDEQLDSAAARIDECAASMSADGSPVRRLMTLAVPIDEVVFGVFTAGSAQVVARACDLAGVPPQRLTSASHVVLRHRETPDSSRAPGP